MYVNAWGAKAAGIFMNDSFAFGTDFESFNLQMRKQQTGLDRDAARAGTDVPQGVATTQVERLKGQQTDGHLGYHLLATVEEGEFGVGNTEFK